MTADRWLDFRGLLRCMEQAQALADVSGMPVWVMQHRYRDGGSTYFWTQAPSMRAKPYKRLCRVDPRS